MDPGDLVRIHDGYLGYIVKVDVGEASKINDWRQEALVMTSRGKVSVHPKTLEIIQKA